MREFFTKRTIIAVVTLFILISGLVGGIYLSQRQTQLKSQAAFTCSPTDYGDPADKTTWCGCAEKNGDNGSLIAGDCPQAQKQDTCKAGVCGKCAAITTCGNKTYDNCDISPCKAAGATANTTFGCRSSENPTSCSYNEYKCGTCATEAPPAGGSGPDPDPPTTNESLSGSVSASPNTVTKSSGVYPKITFTVNITSTSNKGWYLYVYDNGVCNSCSLSTGWTRIKSGTGSKTIDWEPPASLSETHSIALFDANVSGRADQVNINFQDEAPPGGTPPVGGNPNLPVFTATDKACSGANSVKTVTTCGNSTYDTCVDNKGNAAGSTNFCKGGATGFGCVASENGACTTGADLYSCTACFPETSKCEYSVLEPTTLQAAKNIISGNKYLVEVKMTNNSTTTSWDKASFKLQPQGETKTVWKTQESYVLSKDTVTPGSVAPFNVEITAPALINSLPKKDDFRVQMTKNGTPFGNACEPQFTTTAAATTTACFVMSETQAEVTKVTKCDDEEAKVKKIIYNYTTPSTVTPYNFKGAGIKTIFVRFISNAGQTIDTQRSITVSPNPTLTSIACTQSATGTGTAFAIRGTGFGTHSQQGAGLVKVKSANATITSWDGEQGLIIAGVNERLEGEIPVEVKIDDGRTVSGKCIIGTSTISLTLNTQCTLPGSFSAEGVTASITELAPGARPIVEQTVRVSKGQITGFAPKIQSGKNYSLLIQAPRTLAKRVDFKADSGTKNLGEVQLLIGDIAPRTAPDGKINTVDKSELATQWNILGGSKIAKTGDFQEDGAVNAVDYSCQKLAFNKEDDLIVLPTTVTTTTTTPPAAGASGSTGTTTGTTSSAQTTLTMDVDNRSPQLSQTGTKKIFFTGNLKDSAGNPVVGKNIKLIDSSGAQLQDSTKDADGSRDTDDKGKYYIVLTVSSVAPFSVSARFEGDTNYASSKSTEIVITPRAAKTN